MALLPVDEALARLLEDATPTEPETCTSPARSRNGAASATRTRSPSATTIAASVTSGW